MNKQPGPEPSQISASSWNLQGKLSSPESALGAANKIIERQDDVVCLPDAWHEDSSRSVPSGRRLLVSPQDFMKEGYIFADPWFEEDRPDSNFARFHFGTLLRKDLGATPREIRLGTRPAIHTDIALGRQSIALICLYFNDQNNQNRAEQLDDLLAYLQDLPETPTLLMGDFNEMHSDDRIARFMQSRLYRKTLGRLSVGNRTFPRLAEMAEGTTLQKLEDKGFADLDPQHNPTTPSSLPIFQLDRFMLCDPENKIKTTPVSLVRAPKISDHSLISISLKENDE